MLIKRLRKYRLLISFLVPFEEIIAQYDVKEYGTVILLLSTDMSVLLCVNVVNF